MMKKSKFSYTISILLLLFSTSSFATFSIAAYDDKTKEYGVALASCANIDPKIIAPVASIVTTTGAINLQASIVAPYNPAVDWNIKNIVELRAKVARAQLNKGYGADKIEKNIITNIEYSKEKNKPFTDAAKDRRQIAIVVGKQNYSLFTGQCIKGLSKYVIEGRATAKATDCSPQKQSTSKKWVFADAENFDSDGSSYVIAGNFLDKEAVLLKMESALKHYSYLPLSKRLARALASPSLNKIGDFRCNSTNTESKTNYGVSSIISYVKVMKENGYEKSFYYQTNLNREKKIDAPTGLVSKLASADTIQPILYLLS